MLGPLQFLLRSPRPLLSLLLLPWMQILGLRLSAPATAAGCQGGTVDLDGVQGALARAVQPAAAEHAPRHCVQLRHQEPVPEPVGLRAALQAL